MANESVEYKDGMDFGRGYNRLTGDVLQSTAVEGGVSSLTTASGQRVESRCITIQDAQTLHEALGVHVDAGGSYLGIEASAKVDYVNQCDFSNYSSYVLVRVSVFDSFESIHDPVFSADATELLSTNNTARFRERFGDAYIAGLRKGGEFFAIYQLTSSDQSRREKLAIDVHAAYNGLITSAELNVNISHEQQSTQSHVEVQVYEYREGGVTHADLNLEDIMATARQFPPSVASTNAYPYACVLQDYKGLKSPNDAFDYYQIQQQQDVLADLARKRFEFMALRDDLKYIQSHPAEFINEDGSDVDRDVVNRDYRRAVDIINTMQRQASQCSRDASQCDFTSEDVSGFVVPQPRPPADGSIKVVDLKGLRGSTIKSIVDSPQRSYIDYCTWCDQYYEAGTVALKPTPVQYDFIRSGVTFTGKGISTGVSGFWSWVYGQAPTGGTASVGDQVTLDLRLVGAGYPPRDLRAIWGLPEG